MANSQKLEILTGDIGNAFIQANTGEKIFTCCGPAFGDRTGSIAIIVKALYGLTTSAERFHSLLANFLCTIGFKPTRFDRDTWLCLRNDKSGYHHIRTHVYDFKMITKNPQQWLDCIFSTFLIKEHGPHKYYLGNAHQRFNS